MRRAIQRTVIGAAAIFAAAQTYAQTDTNTTVVITTNQVQTLNIALTGFVQGAPNRANSTRATAVRIASKDVITSLEGALGSNFTTRAKLVALNPTDGTPGTVVVRDTSGRTNIDTDVTSFFTLTNISTPITQIVTNTRTGSRSGPSYAIEFFQFTGPASTDTNGVTTNQFTSLTFAVQGFTTANVANGSFSSAVNGTGTFNGSNAVLRGTISSSAGKNQMTTNTVTVTPPDTNTTTSVVF